MLSGSAWKLHGVNAERKLKTFQRAPDCRGIAPHSQLHHLGSLSPGVLTVVASFSDPGWMRVIFTEGRVGNTKISAQNDPTFVTNKGSCPGPVRKNSWDSEHAPNVQPFFQSQTFCLRCFAKYEDTNERARGPK